MMKHHLALWATLFGITAAAAQVSTQLGNTAYPPDIVVERSITTNKVILNGAASGQSFVQAGSTGTLTMFGPGISMPSGSLALGVAGTASGSLALNGTTSGSSTISVAATAGHLAIVASSSPTVTAGCNGAGSAVSGTDTYGTITGQTAAATTCTITFGTAYSAAPVCTVTGLNSPLTGAVTIAAATLQVNFASTANYKFNYHCFGS